MSINLYFSSGFNPTIWSFNNVLNDGLDLSLIDQLGIISTATLASIGAAAVPSAGIIVLVIVLDQLNHW